MCVIVLTLKLLFTSSGVLLPLNFYKLHREGQNDTKCSTILHSHQVTVSNCTWLYDEVLFTWSQVIFSDWNTWRIVDNGRDFCVGDSLQVDYFVCLNDCVVKHSIDRHVDLEWPLFWFSLEEKGWKESTLFTLPIVLYCLSTYLLYMDRYITCSTICICYDILICKIFLHNHVIFAMHTKR